jgi:penicillin amidase
MHLLASNYSDWRQFLLAEVDAAITDLHKTCPQLATCYWGTRKPVHIQHPLSAALPFLSGLLDMPEVELPGDHDMPRVQDGPIGASERFAVSPGHEDQGYIHIPGGQSGHPLSPYYRAGFMDWARGTATPFLPGASQHRLTLQSE